MWKQDESGRVQTPLEPVVLVATLALIPVLMIESDAKSEGWQRFAVVANWLIWAVFAVELAAILIVATRKGAALRAHWLDVAIVVLTVPLVTEALSWLRIARFVRLARLGALTTRVLQAERRVRVGTPPPRRSKAGGLVVLGDGLGYTVESLVVLLEGLASIPRPCLRPNDGEPGKPGPPSNAVAVGARRP